MPAKLISNNYGKSRVRMVKVRRLADRHELRDITAAVALEGDFEAVHTRGDNSKVLPTDTMKNTVYALGKDHPIDTIEDFALHLGRHFVTTQQHVSRSRVAIEEATWMRVAIGGRPHPHTFEKGTREKRTCSVSVTRSSDSVEAGIEDLVILKTTDSAFSGYLKDRFTTLKEARDRIMATSVTARWSYSPSRTDFSAARQAVRGALIEAFAGHVSESVQQTLYAMGERAMQACPAMSRIELSLPNKHCLLVDLSPFGMTNDNEVFLPIDEPHGLIEATLERA